MKEIENISNPNPSIEITIPSPTQASGDGLTTITIDRADYELKRILTPKC